MYKAWVCTECKGDWLIPMNIFYCPSCGHQGIFLNKRKRVTVPRIKKPKEPNFCIDCKVEISIKATRCKPCNAKHQWQQSNYIRNVQEARKKLKEYEKKYA